MPRTIERRISLDQIKALADKNRLAILRRLMSEPASLTKLGLVFGRHPAWIRHHLKQLEAVELVELTETHTKGGSQEKFYRACSSGLLLQELIVPDDPSHPTIVFSGSHDLGIESITQKLSSSFDILSMPVGSLDGLLNLRQNLCHIAGSHLLDDSGEYNLPYVRHIFPDRSMNIVTLAHREQGLMTARGNSKSIRTLADMAREKINMINRNPGSGTRLWLDRHLKEMGIQPKDIRGFDRIAFTHTGCARAISQGEADVGIGLRAAAHLYDLDFIPLFHERYDLIFPAESGTMLMPILDIIQTRSFRHSLERLTGYNTAHTGEQIPL